MRRDENVDKICFISELEFHNLLEGQNIQTRNHAKTKARNKQISRKFKFTQMKAVNSTSLNHIILHLY